MQAAQDAAVPVVFVAQAVKMMDRYIAEWFAFDTDGGDIKVREI